MGQYAKTEDFLDLNTTQIITTSGTSAQSSVVGKETTRILLQATKAAWITYGSNHTAAASAGSFYLAAGAQSAPFRVTPGITKVAAIQDSEAGKVVVIESK